MNRFPAVQGQAETPVLVSLVLSIGLLVVAAILMWMWGGLTASGG